MVGVVVPFYIFMFVWPGVLFFMCFIMVVTSQWVIFLVKGLSGDRLLRLVVVYGSISVQCVLMNNIRVQTN